MRDSANLTKESVQAVYVQRHSGPRTIIGSPPRKEVKSPPATLMRFTTTWFRKFNTWLMGDEVSLVMVCIYAWLSAKCTEVDVIHQSLQLWPCNSHHTLQLVRTVSQCDITHGWSSQFAQIFCQFRWCMYPPMARVDAMHFVTLPKYDKSIVLYLS